jgi:adhesin/invasin
MACDAAQIVNAASEHNVAAHSIGEAGDARASNSQRKDGGKDMVKETVKFTRVSLAMLTAAAAMIGVACGGGDNNSTPLVATSITVNSGSSGQTGGVGTALANPVSVHVTDQNGNPFSGATVTWAVVGAGGTVDGATSTTNSTGDATVHWTLGAAAGTDSLTASIANGQSVTITATATASSSGNTIAKVSGDSQSVKAGTATAALVVKVMTTGGTAVNGATVTWTTTGGGTLSKTSTTTDSTGTTSVTLTTSATAGAATVTATLGTSSVVFTVTGTP